MKNVQLAPYTVEELVEIGTQHFVNDAYINSVLETNMWCSHGSTLDMADELFEDFNYPFPDVLEDKVMLKKFLREWLPRRIQYIANEIVYELSQSHNLYRAIVLKTAELENLIERLPTTVNTSEVGVFWSTKPSTETYGDENKKNHKTTVLKTTFSKESVDIVETFRSRIDYVNGDYEQEIQLLKMCNLNFVDKIAA